MKTYEEAAARLGTRESRKIGNNTYLQRRSEKAIAIKLHATDILTFVKDEGVVYDSGGWRTSTTKARMNEWGPLCISQANGVWFVVMNRWLDGSTLIYADGMRYDPVKEKVVGSGGKREIERMVKERRQIKNFAKRYMDAFEAGKVPAPGPGDCWGCCMKGTDSEGREVHMLEGGGASDPHHHIRDHIRESYYVPSLLQNALKTMGASQSMWWWVGGWWDEKATEEQRQSVKRWGERPRVEKALRRFVLQKLGHAR